MRKILLAAALGAATGAVATFALIERDEFPLQISPTFMGDVPQMSAAEADRHRKEGYASIHTMEDLEALPTDFAESAALYALAGRSNSAAVQNLLSQALGITDPSDRSFTIRLLFSRLAALDAPSALALSQTANFRGDPDTERQVWKIWSKLDFDEALQRAANLDSPSRRNRVAQALFEAYDYWGNEKTAYIAETLGFEPDASTRIAYLIRLADTDPALAIDAIKAVASAVKRQESVLWLGHHLGRTDPDHAGEYAELLKDATLRRTFEDAVSYAKAKVQPLTTVKELLANGSSFENENRLASAFHALAVQDMDEAVLLFESLEHAWQRQAVRRVLAVQLAVADPQRALAWAKAHGRSTQRRLYAGVLRVLADTHPELAIADAASLTTRSHRLKAFDIVATTVARRDPGRAIQLLDHVASQAEQDAVIESIANMWLRSDPGAAVGWIMTADTSERPGLMKSAAEYLAQWDVDSAIRLLPSVGEEHASTWATQIATNLAERRSITEAQSFIARFEGSADYDDLFSAMIEGFARADSQAAIDRVARLPEGSERPALFKSIYRHFIDEDPRLAAESLASIADEVQRLRSTSQVASEWSSTDPAAAHSWASSLPRGNYRDYAVMAVSSEWEEITPARRRLIESIGNAELQKQVMIQAVFRLADSEPETAERLLLRINLTDDERTRMLRFLRSRRNEGTPPGVIAAQ